MKTKYVQIPLTIMNHHRGDTPWRELINKMLLGILYLTDHELRLIDDFLFNSDKFPMPAVFGLVDLMGKAFGPGDENGAQHFQLNLSITGDDVGYELKAGCDFVTPGEYRIDLVELQKLNPKLDTAFMVDYLKDTGWFESFTHANWVIGWIRANEETITQLIRQGGLALKFVCEPGKATLENMQVVHTPSATLLSLRESSYSIPGMRPEPNGASGSMLADLLSAYGLVQLQQLPMGMSRLPQGLELMNLVRKYLFTADNATNGLRVVPEIYQSGFHMGLPLGGLMMNPIPPMFGGPGYNPNNPSQIYPNNPPQSGMFRREPHPTDYLPSGRVGIPTLNENMEVTMAQIRNALNSIHLDTGGEVTDEYWPTTLESIRKQLSSFTPELWESFVKAPNWCLAISPFGGLSDTIRVGVNPLHYDGWVMFTLVEEGHVIPEYTISTGSARRRNSRLQGEQIPTQPLASRGVMTLKFIMGTTGEETARRIRDQLVGQGINFEEDGEWKYALTSISKVLEEAIEGGSLDNNMPMLLSSGSRLMLSRGLRKAIERKVYKGWVIHTQQPDRDVCPAAVIY